MLTMADDELIPGPHSWPVEPVIDLHTFRPQDVGVVVEEFLALAVEHRFAEVRIIHGKGIGNLRRAVRSILERHPAVENFGDASVLYGGLGATVARLRLRLPPP